MFTTTEFELKHEQMELIFMECDYSSDFPSIKI